MRKVIPYNPRLKDLARQLRNNSTKSEIKLWQHIKGKQLRGYSFHRQKPLLNFIADFYCHDLALVIELDGYTHQFEDVFNEDLIKQQKLQEIGLTVLRFRDNDVMKNMESVIVAIEEFMLDFEKHTPNPSQEGNTL